MVIRLESPMSGFVVSDGEVVGAVAVIDSRKHKFFVRRGVILASGDISAAKRLSRGIPPDIEAVRPVSASSRGDGQRVVSSGRSLKSKPAYSPMGTMCYPRRNAWSLSS